MAKELLTSYLNQGGKVRGTYHCRRCSKVSHTDIALHDNNVQKFEVEHRMDTPSSVVTFDIAGLDSNSKPIVAIEIKKNHSTNRDPEAANTVPWVEVFAQEVLDHLEVTHIPNTVVLNRLNNPRYCDDNCHYLVRKYAFTLGYCEYQRVHYYNDTHRLVEAALKGKYQIDRLVWSTSLDSKHPRPPRGVWNAFIKLQMCIRCEEESINISYYNPYCKRCLNITDKENKSEDQAVYQHISMELKSQLRSRFSWLNQVPGGWTVGNLCNYCLSRDRNPDDPYDMSYVWWFGEKKCCKACLEKQDQSMSKN